MSVNLPLITEFHTIKGLKIGATNAGVKQTERPDIVVFELGENASVAGIFTLNAFCAAPVQICKKHISSGIGSRFLVVNTGNANAGTGEQGYQDALNICEAIAKQKSVPVESVLPFSTGVIGEPLPMNKILAALPSACEGVTEDNWYVASQGIMTTDTQPKGFSTQFEYQGKTISISGISKGAGMIKPNMATMLGFIATDIAISQPLIEKLCSELGNKSFNRITIDGDTSTNDSCILMATGALDLPIVESENDELYSVMKQELERVFIYLAQAIVRDGEGATKFVSINVSGCLDSEEALQVAYTVAHSPLVKTALFASDANWGRILAAVGRAGVNNMNLETIKIMLDEVCIVENGARASSYTEEAGAAVMLKDELSINIDLGRGTFKETVWTTDLSHEYVSINADYRS